MREYIKRHGKYSGVHYIFNSVEEAQLYLAEHPELNPNNNTDFKYWFDWENVKQNDWVKLDDGGVAQIMNVYDSPRHGIRFLPDGTRYGSFTIKFAWNVFPIWFDKSGKMKIQYPAKMNFQVKNTKAISNDVTVAGKYMTEKKHLFAYYWYISGDPFAAAKLALDTGHKLSLKNLTYKTTLLMQDEYILEQLNKYIKSMSDKERFEDKLKKSLESHNINFDRIAKNVDAALTACEESTVTKIVKGNVVEVANPKTGSLSHNAWTKTAAELVAVAEGRDVKDNPALPGGKVAGLLGENKTANIEDADFESLAPPDPAIMQKVQDTQNKFKQIQEDSQTTSQS